MIAGVLLAEKILKAVDKDIIVNLLCKDGDEVGNGQILLTVQGRIQSILKAERLLLNCMQRMSGIATKTRRLVNLLHGTKAKILDTRKTTPNFRQFEKLAVKIGGGENNRFGLYDMILIKDNHVDACGGIVPAIKRANEYLSTNKKELKIEIETRSLIEVEQLLKYGHVHRIMFDNFSIDNMKQAVSLVNNRFETEASGSISESTIRAVAETGVDFISVGALTHSYKSLDINLKIENA